MGMVASWIKDGIAELLVKAKEAAAGIVGKVLSTFGLTLVTMESILPNLKAYITQYVGNIGGQAGQLLAYLEIGTVISMILSALVVRLSWKTFIVPTSVAESLKGQGQ